MAADAITRLYDVQKNSVTLTCEEGKGGYRPGDITFHAKPGKSIDLAKLRESLSATRLSGDKNLKGTSMQVTYLEITATGQVSAANSQATFKVAGTGQQFNLTEDKSAKGALQRLRDAVAQGRTITSVTGRVQGWNGRFPEVLHAVGNATGTPVLLVTDFQTAK